MQNVVMVDRVESMVDRFESLVTQIVTSDSKLNCDGYRRERALSVGL